MILTTSCEDVVQVTVPKNETKLVVDGTITNKAGNQSLLISLSQAYFDNTIPKPAIGAIVSITDNEGKIYKFEANDPKNPILYTWQPKDGEILGKIGNTYTLKIDFEGEKYQAITDMKRVPVIDSLIYAFKDNSGLPSNSDTTIKIGYRPEFFARDLVGENDCYLIRGLQYNKKKNKWVNKQRQTAYDAAFQKGAGADGLVFILPIRRSISRELLVEGDSIRTEIYSISKEFFEFRRAADEEANNAGLFATPPGTIPTNIKNINPNSTKRALGWFNASAFTSYQVVIDPKKAVKDTD